MAAKQKMPATMRALGLERYGEADAVLDRMVPVPEPGDGEVLVRVRFAGINFMDVHTRQGKYERSLTYPVRLPCTLGMEGAGEIAALGAGVDGLSVGERVSWCLVWGSYAEYAVVPAWRLARVPDGLSLEMAAASLFQGATAHYLAHDVGRLAPGCACLVHAASGSIGQLLVQLAKRAGARVFATASTPAKAAIAKARGADEVLLYEEGAFADRVRELTDGAGVDVAYDAIGRDTLRDTFRATRARGLVVNYGGVSGRIGDLDPLELGEAGSLFLTRPRLADYLPDAETIRRRARDIHAALLDGSLRIDIAGHYGFDDFQDAHRALENRTMVGKPVLSVE